MNYYLIDNYQYSLLIEDGTLLIKTIDFSQLIDYKVVITNEMLITYRLVNTIEELYEIFTDCFKSYDNKDTKTYIELAYDKKTDVINLTLHIGFKYKTETLEFKMITVKDFLNQQMINNKLFYFNTKLQKHQQLIATLKQENQVLIERMALLENLYDPLWIQYTPHQHVSVAAKEFIICGNYVDVRNKLKGPLADVGTHVGGSITEGVFDFRKIVFMKQLYHLEIRKVNTITNWCFIYQLPLTRLCLLMCMLTDDLIAAIIDASNWKTSLTWLDVSYNLDITATENLIFLDIRDIKQVIRKLPDNPKNHSMKSPKHMDNSLRRKRTIR